jgi:hypothetical protein
MMSDKRIAAMVGFALIAGMAMSPAPAQAGGRDVAIGVGVGTLLGLGIANATRPAYGAPVYAQPRPVYVQPAPVYVQPQQVYVQPTCSWQKVQIWDPYLGHYVWRKQQVCG